MSVFDFAIVSFIASSFSRFLKSTGLVNPRGSGKILICPGDVRWGDVLYYI